MQTLTSWLLTLLSLALLQLHAASSVDHNINHSASPSICETHSCRTVAAHMTRLMNLSADPCTDFYEYACGNFKNVYAHDISAVKKVSRILKSKTPIMYTTMKDIQEKRVNDRLFELLNLDLNKAADNNEFTELFAMARKMQSSCASWILSNRWNSRIRRNRRKGRNRRVRHNDQILTDLLKPLLRRLEANLSSLTAEKLLAEIVRSGGGSLLSVRYLNEYAPHHSLKLLENRTSRAYIKVPEFNKFARFDFTPYLVMLDKYEPKLQHVSLIGYEKELERTRLALGEAVQKRIPSNAIGCTSSVSIFHSLNSLQRKSDCLLSINEKSFSWKTFMEELLGTSLTGDFRVGTSDLQTLLKLGNFLKNLPILSNSRSASSTPRLSPQMSFLIADWLMSFSSLMPDFLRNRWLNERYRSSTIQHINFDEIPTDFSECVEWTKVLMRPIVEKMFQQKYYPNMFHDLKHIVQQLIDASVSNIENSWLNNQSKVLFTEKLRSVSHSYGMQQLNISTLMLIYADSLHEVRKAEESDGKASFGEMLSIGLRAATRHDLLIISHQIETSPFLKSNGYTWTFNAFYFENIYRAFYSMTLLHSQMYSPGLPDFVNIGGTGFSISHEIAHSIDPRLHHLRNLMDNATEQEYAERVECLRAQIEDLIPRKLSKDEVKDLLNEKFSDVASLSTIYKAYREISEGGTEMQKLPGVLSKLSPEKIIFVQSAQLFCAKAEEDEKFKILVLTQHLDHMPDYLRVNNFIRNSPYFGSEFKCPINSAMNPEKKCFFW